MLELHKMCTKSKETVKNDSSWNGNLLRYDAVSDSLDLYA